MNLYFYTVVDDKMAVQECEVTENPKTYRIVGGFRSVRGYYYDLVKKDEIGSVMSNGRCCVLTERNDGKAVELFNQFYDWKIQNYEREISRMQEQKKTTEDFLENPYLYLPRKESEKA